MKLKYLLILVVAMSTMAIDCGGNDIVGNPNDSEIRNLSFVITDSYISNGELVAEGRVKNDGRSTVTSPWRVEGQFYTDNRQRVKLGGTSTRIGVPLSPGQSTFWRLDFSSVNVDVTQYPDFSVGDLRGIY